MGRGGGGRGGGGRGGFRYRGSGPRARSFSFFFFLFVELKFKRRIFTPKSEDKEAQPKTPEQLQAEVDASHARHLAYASRIARVFKSVASGSRSIVCCSSDSHCSCFGFKQWARLLLLS